MRRRFLWTILALCLAQGCSNPSIVNIDESARGIISSGSIIYVSRFEGDPDYVDAATDFFIAELETGIQNTVIQGSVLRSESADIQGSGNIAPLTLALEAAKANGANVLIVGKVAGHKTAGTLNGFSTVRVYEVASGQRIANFHRPSGKLMAYSVHQTIMAAVKRTAADVASMFD